MTHLPKSLVLAGFFTASALSPLAALAGCDDDEIASFSGHSTKEMIGKYAGEARQMMRARQAAAKRK